MFHCSYCHKPIIPDVPGLSPVAIEVYEGESLIVHEVCGQKINNWMKALKKEEQRLSFLKDILKKLSAACLLLLCLFTDKALGQERYPKSEWVKGGVYVGRSIQGNCVWRPFVKTGTTDDDRDSGKHQILGYEPGNVKLTKDGKDFIEERVLEERFAKRNFPAEVSVGCRCPYFNE